MSLNKHGRDEIVKHARSIGYGLNSKGELQKGSDKLWFSDSGGSTKTNNGESDNTVSGFKKRVK